MIRNPLTNRCININGRTYKRLVKDGVIKIEKKQGVINLGLCCLNTVLRKQKIFCSRTITRKNFTVDKAKELALLNIKDIEKMVLWNEDHNIKCFRLSSNIFPHFTDKLTKKYTIDFAKDELKRIGVLINKLKHRIVMHPGQYNQVGAISKDVFQSTVDDLSHHADILDAMNIDNNGVLIVHGGGLYKDKDKTIKRWIEQFKLLPDKVKKRLVIENCERCYNIKDCLHISEQCNIPVVFDTHHFDCYNKINKIEYKADDYLDKVVKTWGKRKVLMHISEQGKGRIGNHSDYIETIPKYLFDLCKRGINIDLEVEAKMKEQAILKLREKYKCLK